MKLTIETDLYNERRYSKPYVGVVSSLDGNVVRWGTWIGTPGDAGILEIEVEPGEIVMHGQKDNRGNNGAPQYAIVSDDGALEYMGKAAAVTKARAIEKARAALASTAQPPAPAAQGDAQQRAMHARNSDNALAEGWKEAAIAWEVCASVHRAWGKGRDALFTTRQADYRRHAQMARERHADLTRPTGEAPGSPSESSHDRQLQLVDQRDPARAAAKEGDRDG